MNIGEFLSALYNFRFVLLFYTVVFFIVYANRKKFDVQAKFMYLYRTKIGLKFMDSVANRWNRTVKVLGYIGIFVGFAGMLFILYMIPKLALDIIVKSPGATGASPVIPGLPIAGTGLTFPLITGWIVIFIIILIHEFSHGIVASAHKIKILNSGMAFFGPILGAFVEPDEKKLVKEKDLVQQSVFAAGPFSNFLTLIPIFAIGFLILNPIASSLLVYEGVIVDVQPGLPAEKSGLGNNSLITQINDIKISKITDIQNTLKGIKPNEELTIKTNTSIFTLTTVEDPKKPGNAYLGIFILGSKTRLVNDSLLINIFLKIIQWFADFLFWLFFLSFNIGLINLLPIFITDGARMLKVLIDRYVHDKKRSMSIWLGVNWLATFSIIILLFLPFFRWLNSLIFGI